MTKKNIYILSEYFKREFHSNILVSLIAADKNFNIYIGTDRVYKKLFYNNLLSPGIFHTKSISHGKEKTNFNKFLFKKKFILTGLDEEHGVIDKGSFVDFFIKPRMNPKDLKYFSAIFCWGNFDYRNYLNYFKIKKFYLTGSPRVDLWKTKFLPLWKSKKKNKKNVLIISNFSFVNNLYNLQEILKRRNKEGYYKRSPKLKNLELDFYEHQNKLMIKFIDLIKYLSKNLKNRSIIFRPHPAENVKFWREKLKKYKNVEIVEEGILTTLISNTEVVVQNGCTSALEAFISKKKVIEFDPIKNKGNKFGVFTKEFATIANTNKQVLDEISSQNIKVNQKKNKKVNNRMIFLDKNLSSQKIVKVWREIIPKNYFSSNNDFKISLILFFYDFFNYYITLAILMLKGKYHLKKIIFHKFSGVNNFEIDKFLSDLKKILKIKKKINVSRLGKEFIKISSE